MLLKTIKYFIFNLMVFSFISFLSFIYFSQKEEITKSYGSNQIELETYQIYKNSDPVIQEVELFIAKNKSSLSKNEIIRLEKIRSDRITELMTKKYFDSVK